MNPIYKFELNGNPVKPIWQSDLSKDYDLESGQQFFRAKLSGKLLFNGPDYEYIVKQAFDFEYLLNVYISYDGGRNWTLYWSGNFWKTDCEFDEDSENLTVTPSVKDNYSDVVAGLEKEYNLIELAPEIVPIKCDKRPMIQVYVPGDSVVGCFLSGMYWEQECVPETNETDLTNKFYFYPVLNKRIATLKSEKTNIVPEFIVSDNPGDGSEWSISGNGFRINYYRNVVGSYYTLTRLSDGLTVRSADHPLVYNSPRSVSFVIDGQSVTYKIQDVKVFARYVCDVLQIGSVNTYPIPADDIVDNNRNYRRVVGYNFPDSIVFSQQFSDVPTKWGLYKDGLYYKEPYSIFGAEYFPVSRSTWTDYSLWFSFYVFDNILEQQARAEYTLRDAYPLASVISVLLGKIAPNLSHEATADYSRFLYGGNNPISGISQTLFISPKSNVMYGYDEPAQRAPITLGQVLSMLRDCFRCYWFVDDQRRFRIEHVSYFRNGGSYSTRPEIGLDLTSEKSPRNGKPWAFGLSQYTFEKPEMAARYQFGWMDNQTQYFDGFPIDILSKYVNQDNIEEISVSNFSSDIDYIVLNPSDISKDGFVLMAAVLDGDDYKLPYYNFQRQGNDHYLQNAYVSFAFLQQYYFDDMPARSFEIDGMIYTASGVKRLKLQDVEFPSLNDPDLYSLIKTNIGSGQVRKISVNLSSRNVKATLCYDTE